MWVWLTATAKAHATPQTIAAKRHQWLAQGKDQQLKERCRVAQRYIVKDRMPSQVFWLLDTDDPEVVTLITSHFGDLWEITVSQVAPQALAEGPSN